MVKKFSLIQLCLLLCFLEFLFFGNESQGSTQQGLKISDELTVMLGMVSLSYTENKSKLTGPNVSEVNSNAITGINTLIHYRFKSNSNYSWFSQANLPVVSGEQGSYLSAGGGIEFTWGQSPVRSTLNDSHTSFVVSPTFRYLAGIEMNIAYIAYLTDTAKKSDTLIEIGGFGGIGYKIKNYDFRFQGGFDRGSGVNTTATAIKAMAGITYFLE